MYAKYCSVSSRIAPSNLSSNTAEEVFIGGDGAELAELQPLAREVFHELVGPWVSQHPNHLPPEIGPQRARACLAEQFVVGHAAPDIIGKAAGQLELRQPAIFVRVFRFDQEQEPRRRKHRRERKLDGALVALAPTVSQSKD